MRQRPPVFFTVPWAPGLETRQLTREVYVPLRWTAVYFQLGIRKGFAREAVKARLASDPPSSSATLAIELGMLEAECAGLAEEFSV